MTKFMYSIPTYKMNKKKVSDLDMDKTWTQTL
jgi:hypothetical protein